MALWTWAEISSRDQFGNWLGYEMHSYDPTTKCLNASLKIRADHLSPSGRVHGGVVSAFLDAACGAAVFATLARDQFCSTVELKVNYLKPVNNGDNIKARAEVVFRGKKLSVVHVRLYCNSEEEPVAIATGTFNIAQL